MGSGDGREKNVLKTAVVVAGGLGLVWLTMETAFKPWLDKIRASIKKSDPALDADDHEPRVEPVVAEEEDGGVGVDGPVTTAAAPALSKKED